MNQKKSEDAVSPVIGVMLLLVVTIVIAAAVAVFASGVGADAEPAPATVMTVTEIRDGGNSIEGPDGGGGGGFDNNGYMEKYSVEVELDAPPSQGGRWKYNNGDRSGEYLFEGVEKDGKTLDDLTKPRYSDVKEFVSMYYLPTTITINSKTGDILDLSKLKVKVHDTNGKLIAEKDPISTSGTISPGNSITVTLDEKYNYDTTSVNPADIYNVVISGRKVEVSILYGEHVIITKDIKVM